MTEKIYSFGLGDEHMEISLPTEKVIYEIEGRPAQAITNVKKAVQEVLRNPIGTPALTEIVNKGDKVCIIVSDITRAWVKFDQFLPILLDELNAGGVSDKDICIVISLGTHRPHTKAEDELVCGKEVCNRVKIYQPDHLDDEQLVYLGETKRKTPVYLNKHVVNADKVIITGGIVYHLMGGFGGGRKSIMPGVSGDKTIQTNHCLALHEIVGQGCNPLCKSGNITDNPLHDDMTEAAAFAKPAFLLNAVFTPEGDFAEFFAGHWIKAWEAGCKKVAEIYGIPIGQQADLVIASAGGFPKDINLYQGSKTLVNAYLAAKQGGVIICFLECRDIYEPAEFSGWFDNTDMLEFEKKLRQGFTIPGFIAYKIASSARQFTVIVVTKEENREFIQRAGMIPATNADEAMSIAKEKLGAKDYDIIVMGHGANTVPLMG